MTKLIYLENQNVFQATAEITEIVQLENNLGIILDQTIFYVQGGGQPGDKGSIVYASGKFTVAKTIYDEQGRVLHIGNFDSGSFEVGDLVDLQIELASRQLNSKIHSYGHLIDLAVKNCRLDWIPGKGFHYPEGSYVEYQINDRNLNLDEVKNQIQIELDKLVDQNLPVEITFDQSSLYKGQPLRKMSFAGLCELPCGGTHVKSTGDLSGFKITKTKQKGEILKLSYGLENNQN